MQMGIEWVKSRGIGSPLLLHHWHDDSSGYRCCICMGPAAMSASIATMAALLLLARLHMPVHCWLQKGMAVAGARYNGGL
ncbi:hypothetical protein KCP78_05270 [Salmonella enterica subsp. enterica]|nr:hypothetical protein KCP78_05270 [Salmonella enterica subsp. enterica]